MSQYINDYFSFSENTPTFSGGENISVQQIAIAPLYSSSSTYAVGDLVMYNGMLYECNTAIPSGEQWTFSHWTAASVSSELESLKMDPITTVQIDALFV